MEKSLSIKCEGWKMACQTYGSQENDAIILVHGASSDQRIWKYLAALGQKQFFVITVDLLGHGKSEKPEATYTLEFWAKNIRSVMAALNIEQAHLLGHSFGVLIVKQFYHDYPTRARSILIVDGNLRQTLNEAIYNWMKTTLERPDYESYMVSLNENKTTFCLKKGDADLVSEGVLNTPKHVLKGQLAAMKNGQDLEVRLEIPVLAMYAHSHEWTEEAETYLRTFTDSLELHVWEDVAHFMMMEQPERIWNTIDRFLNTLPT